MGSSLATLDQWFIDSPVLTIIGVLLALVIAVVLLILLALPFSPQLRIVYRAMRRILWTKIGTTRDGPGMPRRYRQHLDRKTSPKLLLACEGAAFGRTGVIYLNAEEIGFIFYRFGVPTELNVPVAQVTEAKITKAALYDLVTVTTRGRAETLRIYRSDRDIGQEFFNQLQLQLGAFRFRQR